MGKSFCFAGYSPVNALPNILCPVSSHDENEVTKLHKDKKVRYATGHVHTARTPAWHLPAWLVSHLFPWAPKVLKLLKLYNEKVVGRNVTIWGRSYQLVVSERKIQAVLFKTTVICLCSPPPWVFVLHDTPMERWYYMLAVYPVISGCLSSKGPISRLAMLSWCKRKQWAIALQLTSHTSRPCVPLLVFDNDWRLVPIAITRNWMDKFLHEQTLILQSLWALKVESLSSETVFPFQNTSSSFLLWFIVHLHWKADISELQTRDISGSGCRKASHGNPRNEKPTLPPAH